MNILNTYVEYPYIGTEDDVEDYSGSAFGYLQINDDEIGQYILARNSTDYCSEDCSCDHDHLNPAFLMRSGEFCEHLEPETKVLSESAQLFKDIPSVEAQIALIKENNSHKGNHLVIYQIRQEKRMDGFVTLHAVKVIMTPKANTNKNAVV